MRRMEILSIRREYVDIQRRVIYIPMAKAGGREQPMTAHLGTFLESYIAALPEGTPWLFPSLAAQSGHTVSAQLHRNYTERQKGLWSYGCKPLILVVPRDGIEPPTRGFSVLCSTD